MALIDCIQSQNHDWNGVWEKKFERDIVDTHSTPRVFQVHCDVPGHISYYMEGTLESADCDLLLELVIASGERHLISDIWYQSQQ